MKKQPQLIRNTRTEEAAIARGIAADPDTFEPTDEQFARMRPYQTPAGIEPATPAFGVLPAPQISL